jgi:hypothetical protein
MFSFQRDQPPSKSLFTAGSKSSGSVLGHQFGSKEGHVLLQSTLRSGLTLQEELGKKFEHSFISTITIKVVLKVTYLHTN